MQVALNNVTDTHTHTHIHVRFIKKKHKQKERERKRKLKGLKSLSLPSPIIIRQSNTLSPACAYKCYNPNPQSYITLVTIIHTLIDSCVLCNFFPLKISFLRTLLASHKTKKKKKGKTFSGLLSPQSTSTLALVVVPWIPVDRSSNSSRRRRSGWGDVWISCRRRDFRCGGVG